MAELNYMKAVEYDKLPALFKKSFSFASLETLGFWLQRKYDGCFGKAIIRNNRAACAMLSRTGEDYSKSCAHILDELFEACRDDEGDAFEPIVFLGEVWASGMKFPDISGAFRRQTQGVQKQLCFVMNDMLLDRMETTAPYTLRFGHLMSFFNDRVLPNLRFAETYQCGMWSDAMARAVEWQAEGGYDGAILRNPSAGYTFGKVKDGAIIKVKPLLSLDLKIDAIHTEPGEKTGRPVHTIDVTYRGVTTRVGSGVPHNRAEFSIYDIVQIDSLGLTEDGKLREPRFIAVRHDKSEPDA